MIEHQRGVMKKITIFSLDYDGCGDLLFEEIIKVTGDTPTMRELQNKFYTYLDNATIGSDIIELYVGSNRQFIKKDRAASKQNKNGSCFKNYAILCDKKGWIFRKLLLADVENNLPSGSAMSDPSVICDMGESKIKILASQLREVRNNYPVGEYEVDFYFLDDDPKGILLSGVIKYIMNHPKIKPNNVNFFATELHWTNELYRGINSICEFAQIKQTAYCTSSSLVSDVDEEEKITNSISNLTIINFWSESHSTPSIGKSLTLQDEARLQKQSISNLALEGHEPKAESTIREKVMRLGGG